MSDVYLREDAGKLLLNKFIVVLGGSSKFEIINVKEAELSRI